MTRTISLITAVAGVALVLAVPALGKGSAVPQDFWNYDQQGQQIANTSPGLASDELGSLYGGSGVAGLDAPIVSPDAVDRAVAAKQLQRAATAPSPDVVERAVAARMAGGRSLVFDNHRREAQTQSAGRSLVFDNHRVGGVRTDPISATSSGRDIEWPQLGIGFGLGIVLLLGLLLAIRVTRTRPLAH